jgi:hypothetical protein
MKTWIIGLLSFTLLVVGSSVGSVSYMHSTFVSKEIIIMVCERLDRIEQKLDKLIDRRLAIVERLSKANP